MTDRDDTRRHVFDIESIGYTIVENVLTEAEADAIAADLGRLEQELGTTPSKNRFEGTNTLRVYNLLAHGEMYQKLAIHPRTLPIVERVLDAGCLVSSLSSIKIMPGERGQPIHADDQLIALPKPHVPIVCNTMWAITEFTAANGATRLMPGTHEYDRSPGYGDKFETIAAEMPRGSVLIYHGSLWHGGGPNNSHDPRIGIAMNYCAGFIRQQENQQLGIPRDIVRTFPRRLQEMVGYGIYNGIIGHIDRRHAKHLLEDE